MNSIGRRYSGLSSRPGSRFWIQGGSEVLPFSKGTYANASERYILARPNASSSYSMTGPFAANVLATRVIGGNRYGLFEKEFISANTYSEQFSSLLTTLDYATWSDNAVNDPLGNLTADKLCETSDDNVHVAKTNWNGNGSSTNSIFSVFAKKAERSIFRLRCDSDTVVVEFNLDVPSATIISGSPSSYGVLEAENGWYYCYFIYNDTGAGALRHIALMQSAGVYSYAGTVGYGIYFSFINHAESDHLHSYIKSVASPVTKAPDVFYFPSANLPNWLKGSQNQAFSFNVVPNYTTAQLAASKFLFSVDGTENIECYIDSSGYVNIDVDSISAFKSSAPLSIGLHDDGKFSIIPNTNGSNCRVIASGFTSGNFDESTGDDFSMQDDGVLYQACRHTTNDLQLDGLMSEFRKGLL